MLLRIKVVLFSLFALLSVGFSQSLMNAFGIGSPASNFDAASMGTSPMSLLPSFQEGVSISNPVTWSQLHYTYLTGTYGGQQSEIQSGSIKNGRTYLQQIQLIIPIKKKYAFGLSIAPNTNRLYSIIGVENLVDDGIYGDSLTVRKSVSGYGGIASLKPSVAFPLTSLESMAITINYLFGSSRGITSISIDGTDYIQKEQDIYSGTMMKLFFHSKRLKYKDYGMGFYLSLKNALKPLSVNRISHQPFEDNNESGNHDGSYYSDFPDLSLIPDAIQSNSIGEIDPFEIQVGLDVNIRPRLHILSEGSHWYDRGDNGHTVSVLNDKIVSLDQISFGLALFSRRLPRQILNQFHYRGGFFAKQYTLYHEGKKIDEKGFSFGFGVKFGAVDNQIDFGFSISQRDGLDVNGELIQQFSVGISLGDIWFIKRRAR